MIVISEAALVRGRSNHFCNFFLLRRWTLTSVLDLRAWPRECQSWPACQIYRSKVVEFKRYCPYVQKHRHTCVTDCFIWMIKVVDNEKQFDFYLSKDSRTVPLSCRCVSDERCTAQSELGGRLKAGRSLAVLSCTCSRCPGLSTAPARHISAHSVQTLSAR